MRMRTCEVYGSHHFVFYNGDLQFTINKHRGQQLVGQMVRDRLNGLFSRKGQAIEDAEVLGSGRET